jgi:hypothetical protein
MTIVVPLPEEMLEPRVRVEEQPPRVIETYIPARKPGHYLQKTTDEEIVVLDIEDKIGCEKCAPGSVHGCRFCTN